MYSLLRLNFFNFEASRRAKFLTRVIISKVLCSHFLTCPFNKFCFLLCSVTPCDQALRRLTVKRLVKPTVCHLILLSLIFQRCRWFVDTRREFYNNVYHTQFVICFSTGTLGIFATLVYVFTMRVVIYDILSMAIIPPLLTSILLCTSCYILLWISPRSVLKIAIRI